MACFHPLKAWRLASGSVTLRQPLVPSQFLRLPCGGCLGCRKARAREWALRCTLELVEHDRTRWCTLTYDSESLPPTLRKRDLSGFIKRVRSRGERIRFFGCGEYGERSGRPHYHAILFGLQDDTSVPSCWPFGRVSVDPVSPSAISYVAGYCSKKIGWKLEQGGERVDYSTGEVYEYQPPFVLMSRRPGLGASARRHVDSWRRFAVHGGSAMPVPRFLHSAWRERASDLDLAVLESEKRADALLRDTSRDRLAAAEAAAVTLAEIAARRRGKV